MRYPGPRSNKSSRSITVPKRPSYQFPDLELNAKTWRGQNRTLSATLITTIKQSAFKLFHLEVIFSDGSIIFRDIGDERKTVTLKILTTTLIFEGVLAALSGKSTHLLGKNLAPVALSFNKLILMVDLQQIS